MGDPYHVLVSELMLQQTQVATVIDYFNRFIEAFGSIAELAAADEQDVLRLWQGLGYYRRARHLHAAAKQIVAEHGGQIPGEMDALLALPGVGRYTAGAIASIAFGRAEPIVDGNVSRVFARLTAIDEPIDRGDVKLRLWDEARELVSGAARAAGYGPGDLNQAMMELGAMVCTPRGPQCLLCPVRRQCAAYERGEPELYPVAAARRAPRAVVHRVMAVRRGGRYLFQQRGDDGLWSGMWQLPTLEDARSENVGNPEAWFAQRFGMQLERGEMVERFTHMTTHRKIAFEVWAAEVRGGRLRPRTGQWRGLDDVGDLPMANPQRRVVKVLRDRQA